VKTIDEWHMKLLRSCSASESREGRRRAVARPHDDSLRIELGNANTHVTTNMPTIIAGGGFRHGQHVAFDTQHNYPLPNLFVSMLQRMAGDRRFASPPARCAGSRWPERRPGRGLSALPDWNTFLPA